jgi:hypothetical protein
MQGKKLGPWKKVGKTPEAIPSFSSVFCTGIFP